MGGLFGGGKGQSRSEPRLNAIEVTQSSYGNVVPLVYGTTRVPGFLMWYGAFTAIAHTEKVSAGKGGPKASTNTTYTYTAALMLGLCEGPISNVATVYSDKSQLTTAAMGLSIFTGLGGQAPWSYLSTNFPSQAIGYDRTAYVANGAFDLGGSAAMPNLSFEVNALLRHNPGTIDDAEPSDIVIDYCTDVHHGCNFNSLGTLQGVGATTWETWCIANGFFLSPAEKAQRKAREFLAEILRITNSAAVGSADVLRIVPYGDEAVTGNGRTFTPSLTPLFSFTDDDYVVTGTQDPVRPKRKPQTEVFNVVRVEYLDRANQYNSAIAEAKDDAHIALYGERVMDTIRFHAITSAALARRVAQHILQRQLYILNEYEFSVRTDYSLLEPMDLVAITDSALGLNAQLVRITKVDDDEKHSVTFTAEEVPVGVSSAPQYSWGAAQGYAANFAATPGSVATPLIFMAPPLLVSGKGGYEIWIAAAGTGAVWGGCEVHLSFDNATYGYVGTIAGAARYGSLLTAFGTGADPDTGSVNFQLIDTTRTLIAGNTTDADELRTLLYVDGEVMSYRDATLIGTGQYTLGYFRRGKYGTTRAAHSIGTAWARLDSALFRLPIDPGMVGKTLYFKFPSFNVYGQGLQDLSACTAYSFVVKPSAQPGDVTYTLTDVTQIGNTLSRGGGSGLGWDSQAYSNQGYATGCYASARAGQTNAQIMFGLNTDPTADASYTSIDYAWYFTGGGTLQIYESGSLRDSFGAYTTSDVLAISCDGFFVRYFLNGAEVRRVAAPASRLFFDSSFVQLGATLHEVTFQPLNADTSSNTRLGLSGIGQVANTLTKTTGSAAYDAQAYSLDAYTSCYVSAQPGQTNAQILFGLNTDPLTDAGYVSIDYAWHTDSAAGAYIYESGTLVASIGSYTVSDVFAVVCDGTFVRYLKNGVEHRRVAAPAAKLYFDSSFFTPGCSLKNFVFAPLSEDVSTATKFVTDGVGQLGTTLTKTRSTSDWDSQVYSREGYGGGCYAAARPAQTNLPVMFGLNSDPTTDANYTSIDFAWYCDAAATAVIYESGAYIGAFGSYTTGTRFAISWDGGRIRYWKDGVVVREKPYAGARLHFDSSFYSPNVALADVQFAPLGIVAGGTVQGSALNRDPNFLDASAWVDYASGGTPIPSASFVTLSDGAAGLTALRSPTGAQLWMNGADRIAIDPTKTYRVRGAARKSGAANGTLYIGVAAFDSAGANITGDGTQWSYDAAAGLAGSTSFVTYDALIGAGTSNTFPSNARTMAPLAILNFGGSAGYFEIQDLRIEEALPTTLLAPGAATDTLVGTLASQTNNFTAFGVNDVQFCALSYTNTTKDTLRVEISYTAGITLTSNNGTTTIGANANLSWLGTINGVGGPGEVYQGQSLFPSSFSNSSQVATKTFVDTITLAPGDVFNLYLLMRHSILVGGGGPYSSTVQISGAVLRLAVVKR